MVYMDPDVHCSPKRPPNFITHSSVNNANTVKPVFNGHLYNEIYYLWCVLMETEGTNILLLTIAALLELI